MSKSAADQLKPGSCLISRSGTLHVVNELTDSRVAVRPAIPNVGSILARADVEQRLKVGSLHLRTTAYEYA